MLHFFLFFKWRLPLSNTLLIGTTYFYSSVIFGNLLTLVALPYIRAKYKQEFSILQLNSITLILHSSLCDLLYALLYFPHQILISLTYFYSVEVCYYLGMFRVLVTLTSSNNQALISCCLARQFLCRYISHFRRDWLNIENNVCIGNVMAALLSMMATTSYLAAEESILRVSERG